MEENYKVTYTNTISDDDIKKLNVPTYQKLLDTLKDRNVPFKEFARAITADDFMRDENGVTLDTRSYDAVYAFYSNFRKEFEETVSLKISIEYHDHERDGSEDDSENVRGAFWSLEGVYTSAAEAIKDKIQIGYYVSFAS